MEEHAEARISKVIEMLFGSLNAFGVTMALRNKEVIFIDNKTRMASAISDIELQKQYDKWLNEEE